MPLGEFDLIARYFADLGPSRPGVVAAVGDDCALLSLPPGQCMALSVDTLVSGVHFLPDVAPEDLGWRALAVNVSDLAAAGAEPLWFSLALTLPNVDEDWLAGLARGLAAGASAWGLRLVGGDTTRGPLSLTLQVMGAVPEGQTRGRHGARPGDLLYVSGWPGEARAGLALMAGERQAGREADSLRQRFLRPEPRRALGLALRGLATASIDVSDGLLADAGHIAERSGVRVVVDAATVPQSVMLREVAGDDALAWALGGGDDYELCFTAPLERAAELSALAEHLGLPLTRIGRVEAGSGLVCVDAAGEPLGPLSPGYQHFE